MQQKFFFFLFYKIFLIKYLLLFLIIYQNILFFTIPYFFHKLYVYIYKYNCMKYQFQIKFPIKQQKNSLENFSKYI